MGAEVSSLSIFKESNCEINFNKYKLVFLGDAGAGKTHLKKTLIFEDYESDDASTKVAQCFTVTAHNSTEWMRDETTSGHFMVKELAEFEQRNPKNTEEVVPFYESPKFSFVEVSGEEKVSSLAQLYFSEGAFYIVVFDMLKYKNLLTQSETEAKRIVKKHIEHVQHYIAFAPILVVGTRKEELKKKDIKLINESLCSLFENELQNVTLLENTSMKLVFFPVGCRGGSQSIDDFDRIKKSIYKEVGAKHVAESRNKILSLRSIRQITDILRSKAVFKDIATQSNVEEMVHALSVSEEVDVVFNTSRFASGGPVLLRPQVLTELLRFLLLDESSRLFRQIKSNKDARKHLFRYRRDGVLSIELLRVFFNTVGIKSEYHNTFFKILENTLFMSHLSERQSWIVPAMVSKTKAVTRKPSSENAEPLSLAMAFPQFVPQGLFERVVCQILQNESKEEGVKSEPVFWKLHSHFKVGNVMVFVENDVSSRKMKFSLNHEVKDINSLITLIEKGFENLEEYTDMSQVRVLATVQKEDSIDDSPVQCEWNSLVDAVRNGLKYFKDPFTNETIETELFKKKYFTSEASYVNLQKTSKLSPTM